MSGKQNFRLALRICAVMICMVFSRAAQAQNAQSPVGLFENHGDYGTVLHPGSTVFDAGTKTYTITGSGDNIWAKEDDFQFAYKKVSGDCSLAAEISFVGTSAEPHRKACLMIRQSLDADSVYVDVARHGNGMTSLQFRPVKGGASHTIANCNAAPAHIRFEKHGDYFFSYLVPAAGEPEQLAGGSPLIKIQSPFYVGLVVSAHNKDVTETAKFTNVELKTDLPPGIGEPKIYSSLETITLASTDRRVTAVFAPAAPIESPNWTRDNFLIYNADGKLHRIKANIAFGDPVSHSEDIDTGNLTNISSEHAISSDGKMLAISASPASGQPPAIYTLPITGGASTRITQSNEASYIHGWSPDGKTLVFSGRRNGAFNIYTIPAIGGDETQLTHNTDASKKEDSPEYSPNGQFIYFNSQRTGSTQIWRMKPDGTAQEQLTTDDFENCFPHPSPNGRQLAFLSYEKGAGDHPANKDVIVRIMNLTSRQITALTQLVGGLGTLNVPSWGPDSLHLAFVSYPAVP